MGTEPEALTVWRCPDPECDEVLEEPGRCENYHAHPLGDYPDCEPVDYVPLSELQDIREELDGINGLYGAIREDYDRIEAEFHAERQHADEMADRLAFCASGLPDERLQGLADDALERHRERRSSEEDG